MKGLTSRASETAVAPGSSLFVCGIGVRAGCKGSSSTPRTKNSSQYSAWRSFTPRFLAALRVLDMFVASLTCSSRLIEGDASSLRGPGATPLPAVLNKSVVNLKTPWKSGNASDMLIQERRTSIFRLCPPKDRTFALCNILSMAASSESSINPLSPLIVFVVTTP